jgi:hypothetical protein
MKTTRIKADESLLTQLMGAYADEAKARDFLESMRWPKGPSRPTNTPGSPRSRIARCASLCAFAKNTSPVTVCGHFMPHDGAKCRG